MSKLMRAFARLQILAGDLAIRCALIALLFLSHPVICQQTDRDPRDGQSFYRRVFSWGDNRYGELGLGHYENQQDVPKGKWTGLDKCEPQLVEDLSWKKFIGQGEGDKEIMKMIAGHDHSAMITVDGKLYAWGRNHMGQLGQGTDEENQDFKDRLYPTLVVMLNNQGGILEDPIVDADVGLEHTIAVTGTGRVYTFGSNRWGQLGIGTMEVKRSSVPQAIDVSGETIVNVTAGPGHNVVLTTQGGVYGFGANQEGQLGLGGCAQEQGRWNDPCLRDRPSPERVVQTETPGKILPSMKLISAGGHVGGGQNATLEGGHTMCVSRNHEVWAWGDNLHGQLGVRQDYEPLSPNTRTYTHNRYDNVTGMYYNRKVLPALVGPLLVLDDQIAPPPPPPPCPPNSPPPPVPPGFDSNYTNEEEDDGGLKIIKANAPIVSLSAGSHHSLALLASGEVFSWGDNYFGQLGLGYVSLTRDPDVFVFSQLGDRPQMIDTPARITKWDHEIYTYYTVGEGNDTVTIESVQYVKGIVEGSGGGRIVDVSAGHFQSMALTQFGDTFVWGTNSKGQLGTCGCGACTRDDSGGTCDSVPAPPPLAPPPPWPPGTDDEVIEDVMFKHQRSVDEANGLLIDYTKPDEFTAKDLAIIEAIRQRELNFTDQKCQCNCNGLGTCKYYMAFDDATQDLRPVNEGVCAGYGNETKCECYQPYYDMQGRLDAIFEPIVMDLQEQTNYSVVAIAAGAGMFMVTESPCPDDDLGMQCSQRGTCENVGKDFERTEAACECDFGVKGMYCQHVCPVGLPMDGEDDNGPMEGKICCGHGECQFDGTCACFDNWFGERCQLMCPRDELKRHCSNNGTCLYDPRVQRDPWCSCKRFNVNKIDPVTDQAFVDKTECHEHKLMVRTDGWCSFYDAELGWDACFEMGQCGICQDLGSMTVPRWMLVLASTWLALTLVHGLLLC